MTQEKILDQNKTKIFPKATPEQEEKMAKAMEGADPNKHHVVTHDGQIVGSSTPPSGPEVTPDMLKQQLAQMEEYNDHAFMKEFEAIAKKYKRTFKASTILEDGKVTNQIKVIRID